MLRKDIALLAFTAASDQSTKDGYFVDHSGVIVTDANVVPAGVIVDGQTEGGVTTVALMAAGSLVTVKVGATTAAIVAGTSLQLNADGTVRAAIGTGRVVAIALEAGTANERIEATLLQAQSADPQVLVSTADVTLTAAFSGGIISNKGATGVVVAALPAALPGMQVTAVVEEAFALRLDPNGTETIALPSTGVQGAAGKYLAADAVGEHARLICITAGTWSVVGYAGTWAAEA